MKFPNFTWEMSASTMYSVWKNVLYFETYRLVLAFLAEIIQKRHQPGLGNNLLCTIIVFVDDFIKKLLEKPSVVGNS